MGSPVASAVPRHWRTPCSLHRQVHDLGDLPIAFGGDGDDAAAPTTNFLDIGNDLFVLKAGGCNDHDRHPLGNQRDGAVLHLRRGQPLCMNVADFLELQRAFQRYGVVVASAQVEPVVAFRIALRYGFGLVSLFEHLSDLVGDFLQGLQPEPMST